MSPIDAKILERTAIDKLQDLLRTLFQFELSDLDFGIYRLFRLKQDELKTFIDKQLPESVHTAFAELAETDTKQLSEEVSKLADRIRSEISPEALQQNGAVHEEFRNSKVKSANDLITEYEGKRVRLQAVRVTEEQKAEVFNHLYNLFSRYYDAGDFIPRRFYGARPHYAVPYNGGETQFHWANKDQHYVKTAEAFRDYAFTVEAIGGPFRVRFVITSANVPKDNTKGDRRYFFPLPKETIYDKEAKTVEVPFHYRLPTEAELKSSDTSEDDEEEKKKKLTGEKLQESLLQAGLKPIFAKVKEATLANALAEVVNREAVERDSAEPVPLLLKRMRHFTRRNTTDYFIHKNLNRFLTEELEFYIKDQILHIGDLEGDFEAKRRMLRAFRQLANILITFLAQIEDVQLKLFEKRKFVLRADYLVTMAHVPKELWKEILDSKRGAKQLAEWKKLYAFDECAELLGWKGKLTEAFLAKHPTLVINTANFNEAFTERLLESFEDLGTVLDGLLINSENYQALRLIAYWLRERVKCIYIDPPYNRGNDFIYKDSYRHSSWVTMIMSRLAVAHSLLRRDGVIFTSIDENERPQMEHALDSVFVKENRVEELIWAQNTTHSQAPAYSTNHEYIEVFARNKVMATQDSRMFREPKPGFIELTELVQRLNPSYPSLVEIEREIQALMDKHLMEYKEELVEMGLEYDDETKKQDPWRGIYQYCNAEYRDVEGHKTGESIARNKKSQIWIWQEGDASAPAGKQSETTKDPAHPNYRFYRPFHPVTKKRCPHPKRGWAWPYEWDDENRESFIGFDREDRIVWGEDEKKVPRYKRFLHEVETNVAKSVFHDYTDGEKQVTNLFGRPDFFPNPKPTTLIERFILQTCRSGDWVADFFAGSGTTAQAVMDASVQLRGKLKFFISEMGQHFGTVLLPRVQKTVFTPHWQDGRPKAIASTEELQARRRFVKVLHLESYEDALQNLASKDSMTRSAPRETAYSKTVAEETYRLNYLARLPLKESASMLQLDKLEHPFAYTLEVLTDDGPKEQTVDLVETFNYLLGLDVQKLETWEDEHDKFKGKSRRYRVVKGQDRSGKRHLVVWRDMTDLNPKAEREFLETRLKQEKQPFDRMFINGDSATPGFESLDGLFKRLMTE